MKTSESIKLITVAILQAQKEITFAGKNAKNDHFKNSYANLESVIDAIKEPLNNNGIVFIQSFSPSDAGRLNLTTRFIHESGEWIEDTMTVPLQKNDAQGYGSAATYSRRYALAAMTGLYQADDDGNQAAMPPPEPKISANQVADLKLAITDAQDVESIGKLLKSAVNQGASKEQLTILQKEATKRKNELTKA